MYVTAVKTSILTPPKDNLLEAITESKCIIQNNDIVVVSSKAVSIHEGRCVKVDESDKQTLMHDEADWCIEDSDERWKVCLIHNTFLPSAGIDESNANEHFVLLPEEPFTSAHRLHDFFTETYQVENCGVIITDSHFLPLRYGALGVALGWYGIEPMHDFTGESDLFGRPAQFTRINVVDALATAGVFAMGELSEQTPVAVVREAPHVTFTKEDTSHKHQIPLHEDLYYPMLKNAHGNS